MTVGNFFFFSHLFSNVNPISAAMATTAMISVATLVVLIILNDFTQVYIRYTKEGEKNSILTLSCVLYYAFTSARPLYIHTYRRGHCKCPYFKRHPLFKVGGPN